MIDPDMTPSELRNKLMTLAAVASRQPWKRRVVATRGIEPYNHRMSVQDVSTGNFTEEDAELIEAAVGHIEDLVKDNLRKEHVARRLTAIVWQFLENDPIEYKSPTERHLYESAENALMDLGLLQKESNV